MSIPIKTIEVSLALLVFGGQCYAEPKISSVKELGSSIHVYVDNDDIFEYRCKIKMSYSGTRFDETKVDDVDQSGGIPAKVKDYRFLHIITTLSNVRVESEPILTNCEAMPLGSKSIAEESTSTGSSTEGCRLDDRTYPPESRYCDKTSTSGPYRYLICKGKKWVEFSPNMEPDDPRCHVSCIRLQPSGWNHVHVDRPHCAN